LYQSILKRAFEGKLVPQEPDEKPVGVLLERIKVEKTQREKVKVKREVKRTME
jgi:type I restriction enzyme, S subunit